MLDKNDTAFYALACVIAVILVAQIVLEGMAR